MVAVIKGVYSGTKDIVEVAAILREDDAQTSVHKLIKTGTIKLLHNQEAISTLEFDGTLYNQEHEQFFFYFMHPPIQKNMGVLLEVELVDGRTAKDKNLVQPRELLRDPDQLQNPSLPGRAIPDFTGQPPLKKDNSGFELL